MHDIIKIETDRFMLRELTLADVSQRYLDWLNQPETQGVITAAADTTSLEDLERYVEERINRDDVLFLGIFLKSDGRHIGNIKYDPVNREFGYAIMGLLIGDASQRGKAVASEVLHASARWLQKNRNIEQIILGVDVDNVMAIRAYEKVGFVFRKTPFIPDHPSTMVWDLKSLDRQID